MRFFLPLLGMLALAACSRDEPTPPTPPPPSPSTDTKPGVLRIEGYEEPVTLTRVDIPEAPFVTYAPDSAFAITATQDEFAFDVRFVFAPDRNPAEDVYAAFVFPTLINADSVYLDLTSPDGLLATRNWEMRDAGATPCLWAETGFSYADPQNNATGIVCIGTHQERPFYLVTHYPYEYADGFPPRVDVLLEEFRWRSDDAPLSGETYSTE